eukprot:jgi/Mesvir1/8329/Mv12592-RA.2
MAARMLTCCAEFVTSGRASSGLLKVSQRPDGQVRHVRRICGRGIRTIEASGTGILKHRVGHGALAAPYGRQHSDMFHAVRDSLRPFTLAGQCASSLAPTSSVDAGAQAGADSARPNVIQLLRARGLVDNVTSDELERLASTSSLCVYCGFDPTADSLHLGNLLGIIVLSWFQRCGHTAVALMGGATARIGDPSGKSTERPMMSDETIDANIQGIQRVLHRLLMLPHLPGTLPAGTPPPLFLNNLDWFGRMGMLEFLRDVGRYARVGTMMTKDSVRTRLESEQGISFTEFSYQLLQGYDFVHLRKHHGVNVQVGGSDQWGNIVAGTDLIGKLLRKEEDASDAFGLTFPLLLRSDGSKFGKSESGALWLSADKLSPYLFYQYLFKTPDADVIKFLKMLTFVDLDEIERIEAAMRGGAEAGYAANDAQKRLAEEVTRFVHGEEGLQQALKATEGLRPGSATQLDVKTLEAIAADVPSTVLPRTSIAGAPLVDIMTAIGLTKSKSEARKLVRGGGAYLNNEKVLHHAHRVLWRRGRSCTW